MRDYLRQRAFKAGRDAALSGEPTSVCRRTPGTIYFDDWHDGYMSGQRPLPQPPIADGWRDIATAPKDGTCLLLWTDSRTDDAADIFLATGGEHFSEVQIGYWEDAVDAPMRKEPAGWKTPKNRQARPLAPASTTADRWRGRGLMSIEQDLASGIDELLNSWRRPKKFGFALFIFEFDNFDGGKVNYVSNADRADMFAAVKEWVARHEGRYAERGGKA